MEAEKTKQQNLESLEKLEADLKAKIERFQKQQITNFESLDIRIKKLIENQNSNIKESKINFESLAKEFTNNIKKSQLKINKIRTDLNALYAEWHQKIEKGIINLNSIVNPYIFTIGYSPNYFDLYKTTVYDDSNIQTFRKEFNEFISNEMEKKFIKNNSIDSKTKFKYLVTKFFAYKKLNDSNSRSKISQLNGPTSLNNFIDELTNPENQANVNANLLNFKKNYNKFKETLGSFINSKKK